MEWAEEGSMQNIREDVGISLGNIELWSLIELIDILHGFLLYLVFFVLLPVASLDEVVAEALDGDDEFEDEVDGVKQLYRQTNHN